MKMVELFCGAGLLGAGFSKVGFQATYAADLDPHAIDSYNRNAKFKVGVTKDVRHIPKNLKCDLIIAGPPCQGFSTLGKRDRLDHRNRLSLQLIRWARETSAKVVVIENVPQFLNSHYFIRLQREFTLYGYSSVTWILNAKDYGVAQDRKRSFSIFSKVGTPIQPPKSKKLVTVRDVFAGLEPIENSKDPLHTLPKTSDLARARMRNIPVNGGKADLLAMAPELCPPSWWDMGNQASDVWGRMNFDKPANTLRCCFWNPSKGRYIHPVEDRVISLREGARIQGVPDSWKFSGTRSSTARQIGNGVPVPLALAVAKSIRKIF